MSLKERIWGAAKYLSSKNPKTYKLWGHPAEFILFERVLHPTTFSGKYMRWRKFVDSSLIMEENK